MQLLHRQLGGCPSDRIVLCHSELGVQVDVVFQAAIILAETAREAGLLVAQRLPVQRVPRRDVSSVTGCIERAPGKRDHVFLVDEGGISGRR